MRRNTKAEPGELPQSYNAIFALLQAHADHEKAAPMAAYMRNRFPFLGIQKPILKKLEKEIFAQLPNDTIDWEFVDACWAQEYREAHYLALDYLGRRSKLLVCDDLSRLEHLITTHSWWDTVDAIDSLVGLLVQQDPSHKKTMRAWSLSDNIWLRRVAINHQLTFKEATDTALLAQVITNNIGSDEFFINKAIGWSLREFSKTDPAWVRAFIKQHADNLAPLSIKEARKYL